MAATVDVKLQYQFADDTTRELRIGDLTAADSLAGAIRTAAKAFDPTTVQGLYISDAGSSCTQLSAVTLFEVETTDINLNAD